MELAWSDGVSRRTERTALNPNGLTFVELGPGVSEVELKTVLGDSFILTVPAPRERGSTQQKLNRVRTPRVQITYDVEQGDAIQRVELPFVVAVLANLSGTRSADTLALEQRRMTRIDRDNFDAVMNRITPRLDLATPNRGEKGSRNTLAAVLEFTSLQDFEPAQLARQMPDTRGTLEKRTLLAELRSMLGSEDGSLEAALARTLTETTLSALPQSEYEDAPEIEEPASPLQLIQRVGSVDMGRAQALLNTFLDNARLPPNSTDIEPAIAAAIDHLDAQLSKEVNQVLHNPAFQALEATWRGLQYLVQQTETSTSLAIQVLDVSRDELADDANSSSRLEDTLAFKILHEQQYGAFGADPISLIVGAYEFGHAHEDVTLLKFMANLAAATHAPFVAAAGPAMLDMDSFMQLGVPRDLNKIHDSPGAAEWKNLRQSDEARYLALTLPHILLRLPYGSNTVPVEDFHFEEEIAASQHENFLWGNAAFVWAARVTSAFALYGWPAAIRGIEGGGRVEGLPTYTFTAGDGDVAQKCPTEVAITDRREKELSDLGFLPLCFTRGTDTAAFFAANSIQKPPAFRDDDASASARLSSTLPYLLTASRFAQYIKCIMRDKIGSFSTPEDNRRFLNAWISTYVQPEPNLPVTGKARYPLQSACIEVEEINDDPRGGQRAILFIRPDFQLTSMSADMRIVIDLPGDADNRSYMA